MIYLSADWHLTKEDISNIESLKTLKMDDIVIVLGDLTNDWSKIENNFWFVDYIERYNVQFLFIDGNHEDFKKINELPIQYWNGIKVHQLGRNVFHILRGQAFLLEGKRFWVMGGGFSGLSYIERHKDIWQEEEKPSYLEYEQGLEALKKYNGKIDYILTHTPPLRVIKEYTLSDEWSEINSFMDEVATKVNFKKWYFGHFHDNRVLDNQYEIIYKKMRQLND